MKLPSLILAVAAIGLLSGCSNYYRIKDPTTDKDYYTTKYSQSRDGSVSFEDDRTGAEVTLQNSEIQEVEKDVYKAGTEAQ